VNNVAVPKDDALLYKDPANDQEALEGPESEQWWDGLVKEYDGFHEIKTLKLVKQAKGCQAQQQQSTTDNQECLQEESPCCYKRTRLLPGMELRPWL
jgi:hypothetical protein